LALSRRHFIIAALAIAGKAQQKTGTSRLDASAWQSVGGGSWTAQDSEITGRRETGRPGAGFLLTREVFQDFKLNLSFWISAGGSSAILLREPQRKWGAASGDWPGGGGPNGGYEIAIDYHAPENPTGTIRDVQKPKKIAGAEEQWNELEIICRGPELRVTIAGQKINRADQLRVQPGVIGFKIADNAPQNLLVRFQDVVVTSL
jgi:hypothetical protein